MATFKSKQVTAQTASPARKGDGANTLELYGRYVTDGTEAAADVFQMITIPAGSVIKSGAIKVSGDIGTGVTLDVGITGGVVDAFVDGLNPSSGAAGSRFGGLDAADLAQAYINAEDTLDVLVAGATGTLTAGITIEVWADIAQHHQGGS